MTRISSPSPAIEKEGEQYETLEFVSPEQFYREFTQRPDVREIMRRLAAWPLPPEERDEHGR